MAAARRTAAFATAAAAAALAGCSFFGSTREGQDCPLVLQAPSAETIAIFGPGGHQAKDVIAGGRIYSLKSTCAREKVGVVVDADIEFYAQRAALNINSVTLPYFVAVVDPQQHILTEESFQIALPFPAAEYYRQSSPEHIAVHLPLTDRTQASAYTVVVGFQLTPDQIAFNRNAHPE